MLERDGGGAPEVSLDGQTPWYRTGTSGHWGRLRQKTGLLVLFGVRRQGYSTYEMRADGLPIWGMSVRILDSLDLSRQDRDKIYHGNLEKLTGRKFVNDG